MASEQQWKIVCPSMSTKLGASLSKFSQTREYALEDGDPSLTRPPSSIGPHLTPHVPQLIILLVYYLEEDHILYAAAFYAWNMFLSHYRAHQIPSLEALKHLLQLGPIHNTHLASRIFKVIAPLLSPLIPSKTSITGSPQSNEAIGTGGTARKKKGKQRARAFEGDEVLDGGKPAICPTRESVDILLLSLECAYAMALLVSVAIEETNRPRFSSSPSTPPSVTALNRLPTSSLYHLKSPFPSSRYHFLQS